jgi:hypothetical protein
VARDVVHWKAASPSETFLLTALVTLLLNHIIRLRRAELTLAREKLAAIVKYRALRISIPLWHA